MSLHFFKKNSILYATEYYKKTQTQNTNHDIEITLVALTTWQPKHRKGLLSHRQSRHPSQETMRRRRQRHLATPPAIHHLLKQTTTTTDRENCLNSAPVCGRWAPQLAVGGEGGDRA